MQLKCLFTIFNQQFIGVYKAWDMIFLYHTSKTTKNETTTDQEVWSRFGHVRKNTKLWFVICSAMLQRFYSTGLPITGDTVGAAASKIVPHNILYNETIHGKKWRKFDGWVNPFGCDISICFTGTFWYAFIAFNKCKNAIFQYIPIQIYKTLSIKICFQQIHFPCLYNMAQY